MPKILEVQVEGKSYLIPEYWMIGYCRSGQTSQDAILYWHEQSLAQEEWEAQKGRG